ncbi:MAG: N-acetylglucosamine-6-phosphate deacetylase [Planctomycetota bacterium]|jgi:N-acetylglucosamine-6-phosphate deacetylase
MERVIEVERAIALGRLETGGLCVHVQDGWITRVTKGPCTSAIDATLLPAPIDLQVNGAGGRAVDEASPEALGVIAKTVRDGGASAFLPTLITAQFDALLEQVTSVVKWIEDKPADGATPLGLHVEGPFLELAGAHAAQHLVDPTSERVRALIETGRGHVKLVTLAPSLPGAPEAVAQFVAAGVQVSIGHAANCDGLQACLEAGARSATHLFNAMGKLHHREPGLADRLMDDERATCALIPDRIHVHPIMLRGAFKRLGRERCILVTDCMAAAGMEPGTYELGGKQVVLKDGAVRDENGVLAGSAILMRDAIAVMKVAVPTFGALCIASTTSTNPARLLGDDTRGEIAVGKRAELALLYADGRFELV